MLLSRRLAFYLLVSIIVSLLGGSSAPTSLYAVYERIWGFTPITLTVVYGVYALAALSALLVLGRLSDHIGRRPVLIASLLLQDVAMLVFASASSVSALIVARLIQGISVGAGVGAVGAGMLDLDRENGTIANVVGPSLGLHLAAWLPA